MSKNEDYGFDTEFMTDEEVEQMLDSIVTFVCDRYQQQLGDVASDDNSRTSVVNVYKMQQVLYVYKVMKYLAKGQRGVKVDCKLHTPYNSMGYVSVVGKKLVFRKLEWFMKAVELSNNFEVYPKTNGTVQMNFTFHGLTTPVE